jgi:hypothetical protein
MAVSSQRASEGNWENRPFFLSSFVKKVHTILKFGYDRLDASSFATLEEEDITGELTRGMQEALQQEDTPRWFRHFWANEEVRVHDPKRRGKKRKRLDIEIIKHQIGNRPVFRFEAKRLRAKADIGKYLGDEGLGCFLDGSYAKEDETVGMLGYIQKGDIDSHATIIESVLNNNPDDYAVDRSTNWKAQKIVADLATFRSKHSRRSPLSPVDVVHTLLMFC